MGLGRALWLGGLAAGGAVIANRVFRQPLHLEKRVCVITGGSRGLGLALARTLVAERAQVAILARDEEELASAAEELGEAAKGYGCDIGDRAQVRDTIAAIISEFGRIDVLINNAGMIQVGPARSMRPEDFDEALRNNFLGAVNTSYAVLPEMIRWREGAIVNISSLGGVVSVPHLLPYSSSKFALVGFSNGLHVELAREGVHVLTVTPGLMQTGGHVQAQFRGRTEKEYAWFGAGAVTPGLAIDAGEAARQIVDALRWRKATLTVGAPAKLAVAAARFAPGAVLAAFRLVNTFLPGAPVGLDKTERGEDIQRRRHEGVYGAIDDAGRDAVEQHQHTSVGRL